MNVSSWPEIASYFYAAGVRCRREADPGRLNVSFCFLQRRLSTGSARRQSSAKSFHTIYYQIWFNPKSA
jgi:hypothetical protein